VFRKSRLAFGVTAIAAASVLTGAIASTAGASSNGLKAHASTKPTLLVYSAQGYDMNTVKAFQKATGIPTKLVDDSTGPLLARIQAEKSNPQWGLLWVDGATAFALLDQQGLLEKGLKVPPLTPLGKTLVPADKSFIPTGMTMGCTVIYNSQALKTPPTTWQGLLSSSLDGKVGMNDPAVSGPTYPCIAGIMNNLGGVAQGKAYLKKLKANGLKISQTNGDTLHLLETGQIDAGLIQSSAAIGAAATTKGLKVAYLPKLTILPSAIGVDAKAPAAVQAEAQQFIDYVLSKPGQHQMQIGDPTGDSLYWPVAANTEPKSLLPKFGSFSTQSINPYKWGSQEAAINNWFTANIVQ
jgi:iron(III) transport system substrate-binding protein